MHSALIYYYLSISHVLVAQTIDPICEYYFVNLHDFETGLSQA